MLLSHEHGSRLCAAALHLAVNPHKARKKDTERNLAGADSPKLSTPSTLSANLYHGRVTPASTAVVIAFFGRTSALYASSCSSNSSMHGMETTRQPPPIFAAASTASDTSEPAARMIEESSSVSLTSTYAPFLEPARLSAAEPGRMGKSWRDRISTVGPVLRSIA